MICTIRNEILAKIEDRASFLEYLIKEYPSLLEEWTEKTNKEFEKEAVEESDGDYEIYSSIYNSFLSAFDDIENREDMFYKAMLLMTYSYFESTVAFLGKKIHIGDLIDAICKSHNFILSDEAIEAKEDINSNIHVLRNQIAHNIMEPRQIINLERISKNWPEIHIFNDEIKIVGSDFILNSLKKEVLVLKELCQKLGYKHKKIGYK